MREGADRDDGRAAQRARRARPADRRDRRRGAEDEPVGGRRAVRAGHPHPLLRRAAAARSSRTCSTCSTAATRPASSPSCARGSSGTGSPGTIRAAPGRAPAGGHQRRHDPRPRPVRGHAARRPPRRRARRGDGLRGAPGPDVPARRDHLADRGDRPRPGDRHAGARAARARCRSGRATASGARGSSARRSARSRAGRSTSRAEALERDYDLDRRAAAQPGRVPARAAAGHPAWSRPTGRSWSSASATRSATGGCACSRPFGGRVHAAWALALSARIREQLGLESDAIWSDDGIIVHLPDAEEPPGAELVLLEPDEVEDLVVAELGARRCSAPASARTPARALLIPRARPGQAHAAVAAAAEVAVAARGRASKYGEFPIILETYRECLRDVLDVPGLRRAAAPRSHRREISLVEVETPTASPFASSLLFDYVATYMYEGDTPNAERRAAALSLDRDLLRELLGQEELRDLIDPGALERGRGRPAVPVRRRARHRPRRAARRAAARRRPDAGRGPRARARRPRRRRDARGARAASGARSRVRVGGEERWIDAADAGPVPRRARRRAARRACRRRSSRTCPTRCCGSSRRYAATHGPFTTAELRARYGVDVVGGAARARARRRRSSAASCAPAAREREWCDPEVLRRLRRASLAVLRKEIEPAEQRDAGALPARPGRGSTAIPPSGAGIDRLREVLVPLQGLALPAEVWERDVLPRRVGAYSPAWMDQLCASGEVVWIGAGAARAQLGPGRAVLPRGPARCSGRRRTRGEVPPAERARARSATRLAAGACFFTDLLVDVELAARGAPGGAVGPGLGGRGDQRRVRAAARAAADAGAGPARARAPRDRAARAVRRRPRARGGAAAQVQGRWSLTAPLLARRRSTRSRAAGRSASCCSSATGS